MSFPSPLYGPNAGFPKTRNREPVTIFRRREASLVSAAVEYWNARAGWSIFSLVPSRPADVEVIDSKWRDGSNVCGNYPPEHGGGPIPGCTAPVGADGKFHNPPDYPYVRCEVYLSDEAAMHRPEEGLCPWQVAAIEIAHCLGISDEAAKLRQGSIMCNDARDIRPAVDAQLLFDVGYGDVRPRRRRRRRRY